jgi:hypothetical protein
VCDGEGRGTRWADSTGQVIHGLSGQQDGYALLFEPRQQNSWVIGGSGRPPRL